MGSPFDLEADEQALTKKPKPWGWFMAGALCIALGTFAFSYYLPLRQTHLKLVAEFENLAQKSQELDHALRGKTQALSDTESARSSLQRFVDAGIDAERALSVKLESSAATANNQLEPFVKAKLLELNAEPDKLLLDFKEALLFRPGTTTTSPQAKGPLCKVAALLSADNSWVVSIQVPVDAQAKEPWPQASEKAAALAELLETTCSNDSTRIRIQLQQKQPKAQDGRIILAVGPANAPQLDLSHAPKTHPASSSPAAADKKE